MTAPTTSRNADPELAGYEAAVTQVRSQVLLYAAAIWANASLTDATTNFLVSMFVPAVEAAQLQVASLTSVFLAARTGSEPLPVSPSVTSRRGVPPDVVYSRPVIAARTAISQGKPFGAAMDAGFRRLESLAATDVQLAKTFQADRSLQDAGVTFYRRVPQGPRTCALCLIASTRRYRTGNLLDIHPGCNCTVDVLDSDFGEADDFVINEDLLEATHAKVEEFTGLQDRGGRAVDYRKLLIEHEHGELGPVIAWRGQQFTGPAGIPGTANRRSVFDSASTELRRRDSLRGPNAPTFVPAADGLVDLDAILASIDDV